MLQIPIVMSFAVPDRPREVRMEAAYFLQQLCHSRCGFLTSASEVLNSVYKIIRNVNSSGYFINLQFFGATGRYSISISFILKQKCQVAFIVPPPPKKNICVTASLLVCLLVIFPPFLKRI